MHEDTMDSTQVIATDGSDTPSCEAPRGGFAYARRLVLERSGHQAAVAFMEIPPGRSAYPYHWHESITEVLRYVDVDTTSDPDVAHYPDSGKTGLIIGGVPVDYHRDADAVNYYDGEADA